MNLNFRIELDDGHYFKLRLGLKFRPSPLRLRRNQSDSYRASTWKEISFQKEILAIGRKKEGNENFKEIGRKFDGEMRNLKTM